MPDATPLRGHVILVTGGASGIGLGILRLCRERGASVAALSTQPIPSDAVDDQVLSLTGDVANESAVANAIRQTFDRFGRLTGIVNNAGIMSPTPIEGLTSEDFRRHWEVNVTGFAWTAKHAFPHLRAAAQTGPGAAIVNCASIMAYTAAPRSVAYATTKAAVLGMTRAIAMDGAPYGIRCNAVCPGTIDTPMYRQYLETQPDPDLAAQRLAAQYPLGRIGTPRDVAGLVAFLLSPDAAWITGSEFVIDGGFLAKGTND